MDGSFVPVGVILLVVGGVTILASADVMLVLECAVLAGSAFGAGQVVRLMQWWGAGG